MFYPAYVHKDADSAYGVTFPDFPGCFSAADALDQLPRAAQEAVELYFEGDGEPTMPVPTAPQAWLADVRFTQGFWMLIDIDLAKLDSAARTSPAS